MGVRVLSETAIDKIKLFKGDKILLTYVDNQRRETRVLEHTCEEETQTFDTAVIFEIKDEFGYSSGVGGMLCKGAKG